MGDESVNNDPPPEEIAAAANPASISNNTTTGIKSDLLMTCRILVEHCSDGSVVEARAILDQLHLYLSDWNIVAYSDWLI